MADKQLSQSKTKTNQTKETKRNEKKRKERKSLFLFVGRLFNVPATCMWISGTDLLRQFYVLPH